MLIIFGGLPGVGKSTIAALLSQRLEAVYLRIDAIENGLRDWGFAESQIGGAGYAAAYRLATENLLLGKVVVADSVNPIEITRRAWREVAESVGHLHLQVEVFCPDASEHRRRVESRENSTVIWQQVLDREYELWSPEVSIDSSIQTPELAVEEILAFMESRAF